MKSEAISLASKNFATFTMAHEDVPDEDSVAEHASPSASRDQGSTSHCAPSLDYGTDLKADSSSLEPRSVVPNLVLHTGTTSPAEKKCSLKDNRTHSTEPVASVPSTHVAVVKRSRVRMLSRSSLARGSPLSLSRAEPLKSRTTPNTPILQSRRKRSTSASSVKSLENQPDSQTQMLICGLKAMTYYNRDEKENIPPLRMVDLALIP
ncbi:hypothetical protein C8R43DRAFT_1040748 [Mycena crocata]|nr:hypothetical protein C8R43DRAFT_1040748 [Mycena crocata]